MLDWDGALLLDYGLFSLLVDYLSQTDGDDCISYCVKYRLE